MTKNKIIFWITTGFLFLFEGLMPLGTLLFAPQYFNAGTLPLGYPDYFAYALIVAKILGATALMFPRIHPILREWAYAGLAFNLVFAIISHAVVDGDIAYILTPVFIGVVLAISYFYKEKANLYGKDRLQVN